MGCFYAKPPAQKEEPEEPIKLAESEVSDLKIFQASSFEGTAEYDYLFKVLLLGSKGVGKSSLAARYADDQFAENYRTTIGVDFKIKTVRIGDKNVKLHLWDTAGQEEYRAVTNAYFRGAHGVILVYDITNEKTFTQISDYWVGELESHAPPNVVRMIVGNKCDLQERLVDTNRAKELAHKMEALFLETSAKSDVNVTDAFISLATTIKNRIK